MALPVFVSATAGQYVTGFPTNVTTPAGCEVGDLLLAFTVIESGDLASITYPAGWVELEKHRRQLLGHQYRWLILFTMVASHTHSQKLTRTVM